MAISRVLLRPAVTSLASGALAAGALAGAAPALAETAAPTATSAAVGLTSVTATTAASGGWTRNLILNAGAEKTKGDINSLYYRVNLSHWKQKQSFSARKYVPKVADPQANYHDLAKNSPGASGLKYFVGEPRAANVKAGSASQARSLKKYRELIKNGARFKLQGWLGGLGDSPDRMKVTVRWFNAHGKQIGARTNLRPVSTADRLKASPGGIPTTRLIKRINTGVVPKAARTFKITLKAVSDGGNVNDAFADNLSLRLHQR
jgi:hypothetical protein